MEPQMCKRSSCSLHSGVIRNELSHTETPQEAEHRGISTPQRTARASTLCSAFRETSNGPVNCGGIPLIARRTVWVWFEMNLNLFSGKYYFLSLFICCSSSSICCIQMLCWNEDNSSGFIINFKTMGPQDTQEHFLKMLLNVCIIHFFPRHSWAIIKH